MTKYLSCYLVHQNRILPETLYNPVSPRVHYVCSFYTVSLMFFSSFYCLYHFMFLVSLLFSSFYICPEVESTHDCRSYFRWNWFLWQNVLGCWICYGMQGNVVIEFDQRLVIWISKRLVKFHEQCCCSGNCICIAYWNVGQRHDSVAMSLLVNIFKVDLLRLTVI